MLLINTVYLILDRFLCYIYIIDLCKSAFIYNIKYIYNICAKTQYFHHRYCAVNIFLTPQANKPGAWQPIKVYWYIQQSGETLLTHISKYLQNNQNLWNPPNLPCRTSAKLFVRSVSTLSGTVFEWLFVLIDLAEWYLCLSLKFSVCTS